MTDGKKENSINPSMGELESSLAEYTAEQGFFFTGQWSLHA